MSEKKPKLEKNNDADKTYEVIPELKELLENPPPKRSTPKEWAEKQRMTKAIIDANRDKKPLDEDAAKAEIDRINNIIGSYADEE